MLTIILGAGARQVARIEGATPLLYLFFVNVILAGFLLTRAALYLVSGTSLTVHLGTLAPRNLGCTPRCS